MIFCDNDSVCDVITYLKPKDKEMQKYLREFLYRRYNFRPVVSKIGTKENDVADFLSRSYNSLDTVEFFDKNNLPALSRIELDEKMFELQADW